MRDHVMVHHSATADGRVFDTQAIRRFHMSWRIAGTSVTKEAGLEARQRGIVVLEPWSDIGYHALVENVNGSWEAIVGRPENATAAACPQERMNSRALHVCIVGNYDLAPPDEAALLVAAHRVVKPWLYEYGMNESHIVGHHDYNAAKTCPGTKFDLNHFRRICA